MRSKEVGREKKQKSSSAGLGRRNCQLISQPEFWGMASQDWGFGNSEAKQVAAGGVRRKWRRKDLLRRDVCSGNRM